MIAEFNKSQRPKAIAFPPFTWKKEGLPQKLYLHKNNDKYYLISTDGFFQERVDSSVNLPFDKIANIKGLFFEFHDGAWRLQSYNPLIKIG